MTWFLWGVGGPVQAGEVLTVGVNGNDRPFGYLDRGGELTGFGVDTALALCRGMKAECHLKPMSFADLIPAVGKGEVDFVVANILRTRDREDLVDFSDRFWRSSSTFTGRPGVVEEISPQALRGKVIAVQKGSVQELYLRRTYQDIARIESYASTIERNEALAAGKADLMLGATSTNFNFMNTDAGRSFEIIGSPMYGAGLGGDIAIPLGKGRDELRRRINAALAAILSDGTFNRINNTYFPISVY